MEMIRRRRKEKEVFVVRTEFSAKKEREKLKSRRKNRRTSREINLHNREPSGGFCTISSFPKYFSLVIGDIESPFTQKAAKNFR
jgi:hypothetical protein